MIENTIRFLFKNIITLKRNKIEILLQLSLLRALLSQSAVSVETRCLKILASKFSRLYYNIIRLAKINFCVAVAFVIC